MTGAGRRARRGAPLGAVALAIAVAGACNLIDPLDPSLEAGFLTTDGYDDYGITVVDGDAISSAPTTNDGGNTRIAFWPAGAPQTGDHQSCTSWTEDDHRTQQGIALRSRSDAGRTTAITVTKNVWFGAYWIYNVHVMDSGNSDTPFIKIASFDVAGALFRPGGVVAPGPWRLCARTVGDTVSVKVWASDEAEPEWMDGVHGGGVLLPAGWDEPGAAGWYVGHLRPGASTTYVDRQVLELGVPEPPPTSTTDTPATTDTPSTETTATTAATGTTVPYLEPTHIVSPP